jgi:uncharacterized Ntn-hydrolase superfamily protein
LKPLAIANAIIRAMRARGFGAIVVIALAIVVPSLAGQQRAPDGVQLNDEGLPQYSTFSLCAIDPATGQSGAAVTTRVPFVGRAVPHVRAGIGAVCTQAVTMVEYGPRGLDLLAKGVEPQDALAELLKDDDRRESRQVGLIDMKGRSAAHTGKQNSDWAGSRQGRNYTVQANTMVGPQVVDAVASQFESTEGTGMPLAERMILAIEAGHARGGDKRWGNLQSAAIKIADPNDPGRGGDHISLAIEVGENPEPVAELKRIYYTTARRLGYRTLSRLEGSDVIELKRMLHTLGYWRPTLATFPDPPQRPTPEYTRDFGQFDEETIAAVDTFRTDRNLNYQGNPAGLVDARFLDALRSAYLEKRRMTRPPEPDELLRGTYGPYRANNDLLSYHLDVRIDPDKKTIAGKNTIRFKMLQDGTRIQLDLYSNLRVGKIVLAGAPLKYEREYNAVFVDFPDTLKAGRIYEIDFFYSGSPREQGRFGGMAFRKDPSGRPWINTACEGEGAAIWWPNKDQWRDEVERMEISVAIPSDLVDVSNGKFVGKTDLGDGYTRWDWLVQYPINSYNVSLNIGNYTHFSDRLGDLPIDFYVLPGSLDRARTQFAQAKPMLEAYQKYFGEYPFKKDGYKLIEAPYSGMEHQSAVTYGNRFANGYLERDWTGVGISTKFDFIIIHESGHEWFGNAISAADVSDMWIHEGWTTYLEGLYVEHVFGHDDAIKYLNGYKSKVRNREPIITTHAIHRSPPQDMYFKGALFLNTLRSVVNDDARWWKLLRDLFQHFKYQNIMTEDLVAFVNAQLGKNLTPVFDQYLRHADLPTLELRFGDGDGTVSYRWKADEPAFAMPVQIGSPGAWQIIEPTTTWATMKTTLRREDVKVATDRYYINVAVTPKPAT